MGSLQFRPPTSQLHASTSNVTLVLEIQAHVLTYDSKKWVRLSIEPFHLPSP